MNYLTMDAMAFLAEQETALWNHFKKYFINNCGITNTGLAMLSGIFHHDKKLNN